MATRAAYDAALDPDCAPDAKMSASPPRVLTPDSARAFQSLLEPSSAF